MNLRTIEWKKDKIRLIDQTKLPSKLKYIYIANLKSLWQAIKTMKVRGAPALGAAAALGIYLGIKDEKARNFIDFNRRLEKVAKYIASSRPTARNLFWGIERMRCCATKNKAKSVDVIKKLLFKEAQGIIEEDRIACRRIGDYGARLIKDNDRILTICNAGILATIDYGTALGVIYRSGEEGKKFKVFSCETRPLLQGCRLSAWELKQKGIDVTLICDNTAATLMAQGKINKVVAGADRIAANADAANKIGTLGLAILARYHGIPFYIAAPSSTFDLSIPTGRDIPIEERPAAEITTLFFDKPIAPQGAQVFNPAFDVTPHGLITAVITEKGIIRPPYIQNIRKAISGE